MKSFGQFAIAVILFLQIPQAFADDVISNVVSSIVSYEFPNDFPGEVLTNGGTQSPIVSFQYPQDFANESLSNGGISSPLASYQFEENFSAGALTNGGILSGIVSYQFLEWPGEGILNLQYSPTVSYFWQSGNLSTPGNLHGWITDSKGAALSGVTISANILLTPSAQVTSDVAGYYQMPALSAGTYDLWAVKSGYQTSIRALTLGTSTAAQDFQLQPSPPTPTKVSVARAPLVPYTVGNLMGSRLLIFDGTSFVPITEANSPSPNKMTIVMTHGWAPLYPDGSPFFTPLGADSWPSGFALKMNTQAVSPANVNILAWDWPEAAESYFPLYGVAADRTTDQGVALGEALQFYLGGGYARPIHFIGHSLGTLVNASAINYIHGDSSGATPMVTWKDNPIHITLFDEAQIAELNPLNLVSPLVNPVSTVLNFQPALPVKFTWADNYGSSFVGGYVLSGAVNVELQKGPTTAAGEFSDLYHFFKNFPNVIANSHSYAIDWYGESILTPADSKNPLGFKESYEYAPLAFPPMIQPPAVYHQSPLDNDELSLTAMSLIEQPFGVVGDSVVQTTVDTVQYTSNVELKTADSVAGAEIGLFNYVWNLASQGKQALVDSFNSAQSLGISLTTGPYVAGQQVNQNFAHPFGPFEPSGNGSSESNTPAMVWLPIQFPANAVAITFDFTLSGDPADDVLVCGIGTNNLFSASVKYISTNQFVVTRLIDVSTWAGTTNELFFGFLGGTSTNATVQIQNIQFYSLRQPQLNIGTTNGPTLLSWPTTAGGYMVESSPSLASQVWEPATNLPVIFGSNYIFTNYWNDQTRFFRLRQN